jgi:hypothetical protein
MTQAGRDSELARREGNVVIFGSPLTGSVAPHEWRRFQLHRPRSIPPCRCARHWGRLLAVGLT